MIASTPIARERQRFYHGLPTIDTERNKQVCRRVNEQDLHRKLNNSNTVTITNRVVIESDKLQF